MSYAAPLTFTASAPVTAGRATIRRLDWATLQGHAAATMAGAGDGLTFIVALAPLCFTLAMFAQALLGWRLL